MMAKLGTKITAGSTRALSAKAERGAMGAGRRVRPCEACSGPRALVAALHVADATTGKRPARSGAPAHLASLGLGLAAHQRPRGLPRAPRGSIARCHAAKGFLKELQELKASTEREDRKASSKGGRKKANGKGGKAFGASKKASKDNLKHFDLSSPLSVLLYPHPKLRAENTAVTTFDDRLAKLARAMFDVMYRTDGIGLAAPQVGANVRVMVYNPTGEPSEADQEVVLVNPKVCVPPLPPSLPPSPSLSLSLAAERRADAVLDLDLFLPQYVTKSKGQTLFEEGCLSFPEIMGDVRRPKTVTVEAQDLEGATFRMELEGLEARIFQHEYDHLNGVLFHDRMHPSILKEVKAELKTLEKKFAEENPGVQYQGV